MHQRTTASIVSEDFWKDRTLKIILIVAAGWLFGLVCCIAMFKCSGQDALDGVDDLDEMDAEYDPFQEVYRSVPPTNHGDAFDTDRDI